MWNEVYKLKRSRTIMSVPWRSFNPLIELKFIPIKLLEKTFFFNMEFMFKLSSGKMWSGCYGNLRNK